MPLITLFLIIAGIWTAVAVFNKAQLDAQYRKILAMPFPEQWLHILQSNLQPYSRLRPELQSRLQRDIKIFVAEKNFEGCGGLTVTDEMKVTIAAQACMLLLSRTDCRCYPRLRTILVYPSTYVAGGKGLFGGKNDELSARLGESWHSGVVVLSWSSVKQGAFNFDDGHNVTMHEFAHQLDQEDGADDGAPILERRSAYSSWAKVFSKEFEQLQKETKKGIKDVMDDYGATNPAEFFAVATETFFEKPVQLQRKHTELYNQLKSYYKVDPVEWV